MLHVLLLLIICAILLTAVQLLVTRWRPYLAPIPGPFVASFSNAWKVNAVYRREIHTRSIDLHQRYGSVVRIGPNHVSCASPEAMHTIHASRDAFAKSNFYKVTSPIHDGKPLLHLFSAQDQNYHGNLKKNVAGLYTKASVQKFEKNVDECVRLMMRQLESKAGHSGKPLDMSMWLHLYAFDSLCAINVSKTFGFLEAGQDVGGLIARGDYIMYLFGLYSQSPILQWFNAWLKWAKGLDKKNPLLAYTVANVQERSAKPSNRNDMLESFLSLHRVRPDKVSLRESIGAVYINLMAGHDVLATSIRAIWYFLARNPQVTSKLRQELKQTAKNMDMGHEIPYSELAKLPYLDAVVYEALRMHPNTGMILERIVPSGGTTIDGYFIPAGTIVGCNAWILHRNKAIFGQDIEVFRPERWLEASEYQIAEMKRHIFSFGAGPRTCIGRNVAWLQMLKVVAGFYQQFDAVLVSPEKDWKVDGSWVTTQTEMDMYVVPLREEIATEKETASEPQA